MSTSEQRKTIVVCGGTAGQARGLISALLRDNSGGLWAVRAVVRDVHSSRAQQILTDFQTSDDRLSIVAGSVYDPESLRKAFAGAYGVFGLVFEVIPGKILVNEEETAHDIEGGRNIVDAVKQCGVKHFIFSSLPDMVKATSGRYHKIYHMDNKYAIEQYARKELENTTFLIPGAFALGVDKTNGKTYPVMSSRITMDDMASVFTRITGKPAVHSPLSHDEWADIAAKMLGPAYREDAKQMMQWFSEAPAEKICYGALDPGEDRSTEELGVSASTFEDWLKRSGWTGPSDVY
ncbi:hypothetical protein N0V90_003739 [Kalmusia sp. IMI 367209]|nr:hypothetical protein N0V90_003739 [Kalmusia sp. IMI 367209]